MDCFASLAMTAGLSEIGWPKAARAERLSIMKATARTHPAPRTDIAARVAAIDWTQATADLDAQGCAVLKGVLTADECQAVAALYPDDTNFRSKVVMGR